MLFRNKNAKTAATGGWKMQRLIYRRNAAAQAESLRLLGLKRAGWKGGMARWGNYFLVFCVSYRVYLFWLRFVLNRRRWQVKGDIMGLESRV
jgi:hypothetical protein